MFVKLENNITYISSPVFEMLASLYVLQNPKHILKKKEGYSHPSPDVSHWVEEKRQLFSQNLYELLDLFFHFETFIGLSLIRFAYERNVTDEVESFLHKLKQMSSVSLFSYFLQTGYVSKDLPQIEDKNEVIDYINKAAIPDIEKWKLTYMYLHADETKKRLLQLLETYYEQFYKNETGFLMNYHKQSYEDLMKADALNSRQSVGKTFPYISNDTLDDPTIEIIIAPSFFYADASMASESKDSLIFLYGIQHPVKDRSNSYTEKDLMNALKIIGDDKRIRMMKLLSQSPYYGYELAQKMELSNSTISHHLSALSTIGVVTSRREENKVYFQLNKTKVKDMLAAVSSFLTD
ncbi:ArsR/SmtB family transcription factor [Falsibacillus albus]|uniref:ArsR family transcriptional regulator n=1 Tax=Falsibacillus albus TaxID=2478915 RepID=A0A3L7JZS8_9BACI|nr:metalloregulator ArsR/SmtB family transcription factor [Falsibacillus albus]RLQ96256.1 ArsR family transcriptional regulator [Falsibacillus albus]